jgi:hypothetical protein
VLKGRYAAREADDIANLAFIGGKTNRQISDKPPSQYFAPLIEKSGRDVFEAQCIPTDPRLSRGRGIQEIPCRATEGP